MTKFGAKIFFEYFWSNFLLNFCWEVKNFSQKYSKKVFGPNFVIYGLDIFFWTNFCCFCHFWFLVEISALYTRAQKLEMGQKISNLWASISWPEVVNFKNFFFQKMRNPIFDPHFLQHFGRFGHPDDVSWFSRSAPAKSSFLKSPKSRICP